MSNPHMQAAIEAGAKAMWDLRKIKSDPDWDEGLEYGIKEVWRKDSRAALDAAIPHLRAMVAEEIEDHIGRVFGGRPNSSLTTSELIAKTSSKIAAQIAKGPQQ